MILDTQSDVDSHPPEDVDVSVVISSYNRCEMLPRAIESILQQNPSQLTFELIIVNNNSTDDTKQVVESFIDRGHRNVRYVFEAKQGPSHGRNAGVANARAKIIAFTDDDVHVGPDWLNNIKRAFDNNPAVDCVAGKILPAWTTVPPSWLTGDHWGPLAIADYGDRIILSAPNTPICWSTSNIAFRSSVFERIGGFSGEFRRSQDREFMCRFMDDDGHMLYAPDVVVTTNVPTERLTKAYHRSWHKTSGKYHALMRLHQRITADGRMTKEPQQGLRLFDVPGFLYRELMTECREWLRETMRRNESLSFKHENRVRYLLAYIAESYRKERSSQNGARFMEVVRFIKAMLHRRTHLNMN
jgi:glycosyltransferase involved in cell wall biosynthesis